MNADSQPPFYLTGINFGKMLAVLAISAAAIMILYFGAGTLSMVNPYSLAGPIPSANQTKIYHDDPGHLWNRLHSALFIRMAPDGKSYGQDELDPLYWPRSKFLLSGKSHKDLIALLDEFLVKEGHKFVNDPLKRAVFQHDLWATFDWLANPNVVYHYRDDEFVPEARPLQIRLAKSIQRLALSVEQIQQLPDNYSAAITSKTFSPSHNLEKPDKPFLPPDLFQGEGPWVLLGEHMAPAAPVHARFVQGRTAFFVFLNLPGGRKATLDYIKKLGSFPKPLMPEPTTSNLPRLNPELPQFPTGTQVALVREMLTIDDKVKIRPTRIIESIQFRVYRNIPKGDPAHPARFADLQGKQDFYEFRITRKDLFKGTTGGFHAVGTSEETIKHFLSAPHPDDPFEKNPPFQQKASRIMGLCAECHRAPGIHSVEAYRRSFIHLPRPPQLKMYDRSQQENVAMLQKWDNYSWGLMQGLLAKE